jgi:DNA-binding NtrC family response regulator
MRVDLQAKLLRAIQEREIQRLGSSATKKVDVRIVAATREDLEQEIKRRNFREDLFYRLNVVPIHLPPLRDRGEDVALLARHFLVAAARKFERDPVRMPPEMLERLQIHAWPGNVRELENVVERMVVLARGSSLALEDLPGEIAGRAEAPSDDVTGFELPGEGVRLPDLERHLIAQALRRSRGSLGPAARLLGISYKTLQYRIRKHGLDASGETDRLKSGDPA